MATTDRPLEKGLISVIMGNYNTEPKYLREAIDSVLAQTYENFELIIVDDCSTDDSPNVLKEYTDPRIKVIHNEQNRGLPLLFEPRTGDLSRRVCGKNGYR